VLEDEFLEQGVVTTQLYLIPRKVYILKNIKDKKYGQSSNLKDMRL